MIEYGTETEKAVGIKRERYSTNVEHWARINSYGGIYVALGSYSDGHGIRN